MALTLYYLGDEKQTYHEIGEVLGINEETARSQVRYAKNKIKTMIEELRAQGKSFYTVAPLPFLAWMLNDELNKVKVPDTLIESVKAATISPIATPPKKLPVEATKSVVTNKAAASSASAVAKAGLSKVAIGALTAVVGVGAFAGSYAVISKKIQIRILIMKKHINLSYSNIKMCYQKKKLKMKTIILQPYV